MLAMQNHFSVGSNLGFDLDAMYRSSMISGISDTKPVFTVNVGAQWNFLKDKASLSLNCADLFDTMRMKVRNRYAGLEYGAVQPYRFSEICLPFWWQHQ